MLGYMHSNACVFEWVNRYGSRNTFVLLREKNANQAASPSICENY